MNIDFPTEILVEKFAEHWKQHILEIEKQTAFLGLDTTGLIMEIRYEDLCSDPHKQLSLITKFMGLRSNRLFAIDHSYIKNTNHKYQQELSLDTIQRIEEIMQPALSLKGY